MTDTLITHFREDMLEKLIEEAKAQGLQTVGDVYRVGNRFYVKVVRAEGSGAVVTREDVTAILDDLQAEKQEEKPAPVEQKPKRTPRKKKEA